MDELSTQDREFAEDIVGNHNPSDSEDVTAIKDAAKQFIAVMHARCPHGRRRSIAITEAETAVMFAVKSLFQG